MEKVMELTAGIQHIGLPVADFEKSKAFYTGLGFAVDYETVLNGVQHVMFLKSGSLVIEAYEDETVKAAGAINHFAIDCTDIETAYAYICENGYKVVSNAIEDLPFYENGVRFFIIQGPDMERVEFNQRL